MQFKRSMLLGALAALLFAVIRMSALSSLYESRERVGGLTYDQTITWAVFTSVLYALMLTPWAYEYPRAIRQGTVVADLLRPVNTFVFYFVSNLGRIAALILVRVLPMIVFAIVVLRMPLPDSVVQCVLLMVSFMLFTVASIAFLHLLGAAAFFTSEWGAWYSFGFYVSSLIGGIFVPIEYFPGVIGSVLVHGPGMAFMASPTRIFNDVSPVETLITQTIWTLFFFVLSWHVLHLGRKRLVSFGG